MNKLIIALSLACASACVFADITPYENLKTTPLPWFDVDANNLASPNGCVRSGAGSITAEGGVMVVDSEMGKPVTFMANNATDKEIVTVTIKMAASAVPELQPLTDAKVAFAIAAGAEDTRSYKAWLGGSDWVTLVGDMVADETEYQLVVRFDNRDTTKKVQFEVEGGALKGANNETWLSYGATPVAAQLSVDLVGSGKVKSLEGWQLSIQAEVIQVGDLGKLYVPEEIAKAYPDLTKKDPELKADVDVATAIALGFIKEGPGGSIVKNTTADFTVKADATAKYSDAIPVIFPKFNPANVAEQTVIAYQLMGSTDGSNYEIVNIDGKETVDSVSAVKIPTSAIEEGKRYFKVVTKVSVRDPNN